MKNPTFAALAHMNVRVRGRAKVGLFAAFAAAITNLRAADRWRADLARIRALNDAITAASKSRAKRRSHTLDQLLPAKHRRKNARRSPGAVVAATTSHPLPGPDRRATTPPHPTQSAGGSLPAEATKALTHTA